LKTGKNNSTGANPFGYNGMTTISPKKGVVIKKMIQKKKKV
jgi:hypothetical protein